MKNIYEYIKLPLIDRQAHIDLSAPCMERGGMSTHHRGVLAEFLGTTFPKMMGIDLCHACGNGLCSNPRHLYWGTRRENVLDDFKVGIRKIPWENMVNKHGVRKAKKLQRMNKTGRPKCHSKI